MSLCGIDSVAFMMLSHSPEIIASSDASLRTQNDVFMGRGCMFRILKFGIEIRPFRSSWLLVQLYAFILTVLSHNPPASFHSGCADIWFAFVSLRIDITEPVSMSDLMWIELLWHSMNAAWFSHDMGTYSSNCIWMVFFSDMLFAWTYVICGPSSGGVSVVLTPFLAEHCGSVHKQSLMMLIVGVLADVVPFSGDTFSFCFSGDTFLF